MLCGTVTPHGRFPAFGRNVVVGIPDTVQPACSAICQAPATNLYSVIQGVSRLSDITAGGDFLGRCDEKNSYKHVSDFGRLRSYGRFLIPVHALV